MKKKAKVVLFLYNRLFDPLVQSNFWLYIEDLLKSSDNPYRIHVISFEDEQFPLTVAQHERLTSWQKLGLSWTPIKWHKGTSFLSKSTDLLLAFMSLVRLRLSGYRHIVSYGSVSSAIAYLCAAALRLKLFIHTFEPHSEYMRDSGAWSEKSWNYIALHYLEKKSALYAKVIASGTTFMEERVKSAWRARGRFYKIGSVADEIKFNFNQHERDSCRKELGLTADQWVIFYPGKFGSLYYTDETAWMFRWLRELEPRLHFLIVTPHSDEEVKAIFNRAGVDPSEYTVAHSDYLNIHRYYFAADFGVIAVPPGPSKKFISNIKVGEYLCSGLPFLITRGVSEDYVVASQQDVGVVVRDFDEIDIKSAWPSIRRFLDTDPATRRAHCREVGLEYRGFHNLNPVFKSALAEFVRD